MDLLPVFHYGIHGVAAVCGDGVGAVGHHSLVHGDAVGSVPPVVAGGPWQGGAEAGKEVVQGPSKNDDVVHVGVEHHHAGANPNP